MNINWKRTGKLAAVALGIATLAGSVAAVAGEHGRGFGGKRIQARFEEILDKLNATPEQRQQLAPLEAKIVADVKAAGEAHRAILKELHTQIGQDTVNLTAFDQLVASQRQSNEQLQADIRAGIQQFHDTLSPTQRGQFAQLKMHHPFEKEAEPVQ